MADLPSCRNSPERAGVQKVETPVRPGGSLGRPPPRGTTPPEEVMGGDPLESWRPGPPSAQPALKGRPVGEARRFIGPGLPLGVRCGVGQARSSDAAPTSLSDTLGWGGNFSLRHYLPSDLNQRTNPDAGDRRDTGCSPGCPTSSIAVTCQESSAPSICPRPG